MRSLLLATLCLFVTSPIAFAAQGDPLTSAEEHSKRGVQLYAEGKLPEAVGEMLKAYELAPEPGLLYNIARIYQKMDQRDLALHYLKQFVTQPGADPDRVQKALKHLEELNKRGPEAPRPLAPTLAPEATTPSTPPPSAPAPAAVDPVTPSTTLAQTQAPDHTAAWALLASGGAALIAGGVLGGLALSASSTLDDGATSYADKRDAQARASDLALGADISIGVGAAVALVGLVLWLSADDGAPPAAALTPTFGPHHAGAQMTLRFP